MSDIERQCLQCLQLKPLKSFPQNHGASQRQHVCRLCQQINKQNGLRRCAACGIPKSLDDFRTCLSNRVAQRCKACEDTPRPKKKGKQQTIQLPNSTPRPAEADDLSSFYYPDDFRKLELDGIKAGDVIRVKQSWEKANKGTIGEVQCFVGKLVVFVSECGIKSACRFDLVERVGQ